MASTKLLELIGTNGQVLSFTLFFDYDRDNLAQIDWPGRIEWMRRRTEFILLRPLSRMFDRSSCTHSELNCNSTPCESYGLTVALQAVANGIETFGSFVSVEDRNNARFYRFLQDYMPTWYKNDINLRLSDEEEKGRTESGGKLKKQFPKENLGNLPFLLWKSLRNGLTHDGVSSKIFTEYKYDNSSGGYAIRDGSLYIGPCRFYRDFEEGVRKYFCDLATPGNKQLYDNFKMRFNSAYPLGKLGVVDDG